MLLWTPIAGLAATVHIVEVVDGDTVRTPRELVRIIGINAPEFGRDGARDEPLASAAREFVARRVEGRTVRLDPGPSPRDRYRRLLAHVYFDGDRHLGVALVEAGLAVAIAISPNVAMIGPLMAAERRARTAARGIWSEPYYRPREAGALTRRDKGFRFVSGRIERQAGSGSAFFFELTHRFRIAVPRRDWERYFDAEPEGWVGRRVTVRGWVVRARRSMRMWIRHPAMVEPAS